MAIMVADRLRAILRWFFLTVCVGILLAVSFGVIGEFFIEWARERGWYDAPAHRARAMSDAMIRLFGQTASVSAIAVIFGMTFGLWTDWLLRTIVRRANFKNELLGERMLRFVSEVLAAQKRETSEIEKLRIKGELSALQRALEPIGLPGFPEICYKTGMNMVDGYARMFALVGPLIRDGHIGEALSIGKAFVAGAEYASRRAEQITAAARMPQSPPLPEAGTQP